MKRGPAYLAAIALIVVILAGASWVARARAGTGPLVAHLPTLSKKDDSARAPEGVRIRVEVLNTTKTRGLARRATKLLRDRGFDVVEMGTTSPMAESTVVIARSGHPEWAALVAKALGAGTRTEVRPDSSRYLDVSVWLGRTWRPPAQPLDP